MAEARLSAIVLAAGQGTRMKSELAKVLHEIGGEPLFSYPVRRVLDLGASPIVLVVGHQADDVRRVAEQRFHAQLGFELQAEQKGTGHAVMMGMKSIPADFEGRVLLLYGDVPLLSAATLSQMIARIDQSDHPLLVAVTAIVDAPTGYGRIVRGGDGTLEKVVEEKDASPEQRKITEINAGIYCVEAAFLRESLGRLKSDNAQREYYLTDVVAMAKGRTATVTVADPREVLGVNNRAELAFLDAALREEINRGLMLAGVTMIDPQTTYVSRQATIGPDTVIHPGVHIRGATKIGRGCTIDAGCVIDRAIIAEGVQVRAYSVIEEAKVQSGAIIGPFARLRPEADIGEAAHVGNFVEVKKSKLGPGAKANHLAYLGDAEVGAGSNVGAGTITCNYDGQGKYLTQIGERVFIGSNSTLVAPVAIGDEAYVAAGSTITGPVPAGALSFGRAKQVDKPGRAAAIRSEAKKRAEQQKKK